MIPGVTASSGTPGQPAPIGDPAVWIAVGSTSLTGPPVLVISADTDATSWNDRSFFVETIVAGAVLKDVCYSYSLNRWVAVGYDDFNFGEPVIVYSDDGGNTWTNSNILSQTSNFMVEGCCWNGAKFVAVGHNSGFTASVIANSSDGISWTLRTANPTTTDWYRVNGVTGLTIAVADDTSSSGKRIGYSTDDGDTWSAASLSVATAWLYGIVCIEGFTHVATGSRSSTQTGLLTSTNGSSWTEQNTGLADTTLAGVDWNGTTYAAVGLDFNNNLEGRAASSTNATTWTSRTPDPAGPVNTFDGPNFLDVAAARTGSNGFVAVGRDNNGFNIPYVMYSADGLTWTARSTGLSGCILEGVGCHTGFIKRAAITVAGTYSLSCNATLVAAAGGVASFTGAGVLSCNATISAGVTTHSGVATFAGAGSLRESVVWSEGFSHPWMTISG